MKADLETEYQVITMLRSSPEYCHATQYQELTRRTSRHHQPHLKISQLNRQWQFYHWELSVHTVAWPTTGWNALAGRACVLIQKRSWVGLGCISWCDWVSSCWPWTCPAIGRDGGIYFKLLYTMQKIEPSPDLTQSCTSLLCGYDTRSAMWASVFSIPPFLVTRALITALSDRQIHAAFHSLLLLAHLILLEPTGKPCSPITTYAE